MYKQKYIYIQPSERTDGEGKWMGKMAGILEILEDREWKGRSEMSEIRQLRTMIAIDEKVALHGMTIPVKIVLKDEEREKDPSKGTGSLRRLLIAGCIQRKEQKYRITDKGQWVLTQLRTTHKQVRIPRDEWIEGSEVLDRV